MHLFVWRDRTGEGSLKRLLLVTRFNYLSGSHLQSEEKSRQPLVLVLIGQFCPDVIVHQNVKVVVIGRLLLLLFSICLLFVGFVCMSRL